jgi:hypothetical protein
MSKHHCELHDWQTIGEVGTDTATLAIVAPEQAMNLARHWKRFVDELNRGARVPPTQFEELKLGRPDYWAGQTLLDTTFADNVYDVEARFCDDYLGNGHLSICELRIRLHHHDDAEASAA